MSAAPITPIEIFKVLGEQKTYGEVSKEAQRIYRNMSLLGMDITHALSTAMDETPSPSFREFLQGILTTISSGGELKQFFLAKSDQYMRQNRQIMKENIESIGVMAESYVTTAVAGPLFILVAIIGMSWTTGGVPIFMLYAITLALILGLNPIFGYIIYGMTSAKM